MRRDNLTMKIAMLDALQKPMLITHIMYETNINHEMVKRELENLMMKNLVTTVLLPKKPFQKCNSENAKQVHYVSTSEGTEILDTLLKVKAILTE